MKISVVIPCYGSEATIEEVVCEVVQTIEKHKDSYEIILVNDCSPDNVWSKIVSLAQKYEAVRGFSLSKNFGQHSALMAGYRHANGDYIISMDDDGQTPVDELYKLLDKMEQGYDVVYASYPDKKHGAFRNFGSRVNDYMCEKLLDKPKGLRVTSYFAASKFIIEEICKYENSFTYVLGLVLRTTKNIGTVDVTHRKRQQGKSGYTMSKLLSLWMNGFTAFSVKPLRLASMMGIGFSFVGFVCFIIILLNKFTNPNVPIGWSSMIATLLVVGGVILFTLGIIGEYLGRVYISINDAPQYVIKEKTDDEK